MRTKSASISNFRLPGYSLLFPIQSEMLSYSYFMSVSGVPRIFFRGGSTNSVEPRGQRERGSGGVAP